MRVAYPYFGAYGYYHSQFHHKTEKNDSRKNFEIEN